MDAKYMETIGSHMWFGKVFLADFDRDRLAKLKPDWILQNDSILEIKVQEDPFTKWDGPERELQFLLRDVLFNGTT